MLTFPLAFKGLLVAACAIAGWNDVYHRRIPNWLCAATAVAGLAFALFAGGLPALGSHALHGALALVAGMLLFRLGVLGGGDAKFYAAAAAWFALEQGLLLLISVALGGLLLLIVWFIYRRAAGKPVRRSGGDPGDSLPYGVAIGAGALVSQLMLA